MSEPSKRNIGNFFLGLSLLLAFLGLVYQHTGLFNLGCFIGMLWVFGKLVAFIARSLGVK